MQGQAGWAGGIPPTWLQTKGAGRDDQRKFEEWGSCRSPPPAARPGKVTPSPWQAGAWEDTRQQSHGRKRRDK